MSDDMTLLGEYTRHNSEDAFRTLVSRHVNLVYSVALRQVGNTHLAEEITQAVFIILARKAPSLSSKTILAGWLCRTAHYASANALTIQRRRQQREQEAYMQSIENEPSPDAWAQLAPLLDGALAKLDQKDHDALVLRFFEKRSLSEVGSAMGTSEDAAKKRVSRALEKLRKIFSKRGVTATAVVIAGAISTNSIQAAPTVLAKTTAAAALAKGATASTSTLTLIKGALKLMAWSKTKTTVIASIGILLLGGGITAVVLKAKGGAASAIRSDDPVANQFQTQPPIDANLLRQQLVGNWALEAKRLGVDKDYTRYNDNNRQKTWTLTNWAIVRYDAKSNVIYSASGPYELQGDHYFETVQNGTGIMKNFIGTTFHFRLRVDGDKYYQTALGDKPSLEEIGHRMPE